MPTHDLIIIGAGPGGYVAAVRAAQLGMNVACVEKEAALGGTCLRVGCIPSKALLESSERYWEARHALDAHGVQIAEVRLDLDKMLGRKNDIVLGLTAGVKMLFDKHRITRYRGHARFEAPGRVAVEPGGNTGANAGAEPVVLEAPHVIIATGSKPASLRGVEFDGNRVTTSTEGLGYPTVPRHLVVIGAGYIGLELGSVWARLGAKVTVLEFLDRILPGMDAEIAAEALKSFRKQGMEFRLGTKVTAVGVQGNGCLIEREGAEPIQAERVLVAVGRVPNTDGLALDRIGIQLDAKGRVPVGVGNSGARRNGGSATVGAAAGDEVGSLPDSAAERRMRFATTCPGVYAIGDCIEGPMLAHKAMEEGVACVEHIAGRYGHVDYNSIPAVCYTQPEIASVGKTEEELQAAGGKPGEDYRKGVFHFRANGRARCLGQTEGRVKILANARTDRVLGIHIVGPRAGDMIAEAAAAIAFGASSEDIALTSHAHPTLAECMKEAALAVDGRPLHA